MSALSLELDGFVAVTAAMHAGFADARVTFECSFPPLVGEGGDKGFLVLAGIEPLLDALERFKLKNDELAWLESLGAIDGPALKRLADMHFSCDVDAALEGSVVFPGEAVLTVEGPFWQAQLMSALVRGAITSSTTVATKAARCVLAAEGCEIIEASAATAHRLGGNPLVARAAFVGGAHATTSALAARRYRMPVRAAMPLRFALGASSPSAAFASWLQASQGKAILRLDPRDAAASLAAAIEAVKRPASQSSWHDVEVALEIPGGDHLELARAAAAAFKAAGLAEPIIVASGDFDELAISELRRQNAPISAFSIASFDAPDESMIAQYDMAAIEADGQWSPRLRVGRTAATSSDPGRKFVVRYVDAEGHPLADVSCATNERIPSAKDVRFVDRTTGFPTRVTAASSSQLLTNVMRAGKRVSLPEAAKDIRERSQKNVLALFDRHRRLRKPTLYPVGMTAALAAIKTELLTRASNV
jgi:nicotinate phosphoribosyltransferase